MRATIMAVLLIVFSGAVQAQDDGAPDTRALLDRIQKLEAQASRREARIQELEQTLDDVRSGRDGQGELVSLVERTLQDEDVIQVTAPKSQTLKIGGQLRFRGEYRSTRNYGSGVDSDTDFVLQRTRLWFDFRVIEDVRVFVQIQDSRLWGEESSPVSDEAGVDIHQAYVDFENVFGQPWTFRVGRQEFNLGDQRLFSPLDWSVVGRSFDAIRTWWEADTWQLHLMVTNVGEFSQFPDPGEAVTDGFSDDDHVLAGAYFAYRGIEDHELDVYLFYRTLATAMSVTDSSGALGELEDYTIGLRFKGHAGGFFYSAEGVYQTGDRATEDISAYAWALVFGYGFDLDWKPKISVEWDYATGDDDPTDGDYGTFDPLFPFGHFYQGFLDIFSWKNGHDLVAKFSVEPVDEWWMEAALHWFLLDSDTDAWYGANGKAIRRTTAGGVDNDVGVELDLHVKHSLNAATKLWFGYSHFFAGGYVDDTGQSPDTDWFWFQMTINF